MDVAQNPEVADELALERKDWSAVPPHMTPCRWDTEQLAPMVAMEAQFAKDLIALFPQGQDVGGVAVERSSDELNIANELLVPYERRTERATEGEPRMEQLRYQRGVCLVPHLLVEDAHHLLLTRPRNGR